MRRRRTRETLLIAAILAGGSVSFAAPAFAQDPRELEGDLRDLENETQQALRDPLRSQDLRSPTYVEERIADGELFFRLQDYIRASIILTDIVENYPRHPAMPDALYLLGESLYAAGDSMGARTRLRQLIERADETQFRPYAARALGRLIEIAIRTRNFDGVEGYFERLSRLPPQEVEAATAYFRAKYLYNRAVPTEDVTRGDTELKTAGIDVEQLNQARLAFEAVAESSPYYPQARYFVGVILTLQRQFPQAVEAFRRVLRVKATTPEHQLVIELSQLALGRLYYETDQLDQAIETYQSVPRTSKWFDVALYEIAWVYIRMGDSTRAERALEVLVIAAPESRYIADGSILRGNLLLRNGRLDDASVAFTEASKRYGPLRDKLDKVMAEHADTQAYFRELVRANVQEFDAATIFPPEVVAFATEEADMERALHVLSDLSQSRTQVRETGDLIRRLDGALSVPNRVNVFPDLRKHRQRTTAIRNRSLDLQRGLIAYLEKRVANPSGELAELQAERKKLDVALADMPRDSEDFNDRDADLLGGFKEAARELNRLEIELLGLEARVTATSRFLHDTADARKDAAGIAAIDTELAGHRTAIAAYQEQITETKFLLETGRLQVGVGDTRYQHDDQVRARYLALIDRERKLLAAAGVSGADTEGMFVRLASIEANVASRDADVDRVLEERTAEMRRVLSAENTNVEGYRTQLATFETEAEDVVGGVTYASFAGVRQRFYDLVLRADVGTIDVSWADREEHRKRVELLTRERAREIKALDDEFQEIMDQPKPQGEEQ